MRAKVTRWMVVAAGAALFAASGEALAPADSAFALSCAVAAPVREAASEQASPLDPAQRVLVKYLSRRYAVAAEATARVVQAADRAAAEVGLDPLLVLAVISIESRFNPIAESAMGAKGLMQIIPKYHRARLDALGGEDSVLDPESNILLGTQILQEYVRRTGTLEAGLQYYNGAFSDESAQYAQRVMAERERLEQVVRSRGRT